MGMTDAAHAPIARPARGKVKGVGEPAIRLRGVVKRYREITAVDGLDLDVPVGTCVGLLGPSGFDRRLTVGDQTREVTLEPAQIRWLDAQTHSGENIGGTPTHVVFVELKGEAEARTAPPTLGPSE